MNNCEKQLFIDWGKCDATYAAEKAACNGDPECIKAAMDRRKQCEDAAYLRFLKCLKGKGGSSGSPPPSSTG